MRAVRLIPIPRSGGEGWARTRFQVVGAVLFCRMGFWVSNPGYSKSFSNPSFESSSLGRRGSGKALEIPSPRFYGKDKKGHSSAFPNTLARNLSKRVSMSRLDMPPTPGSDNRMKRFTILVVDRNRHVREFLRRELMQEGYGVEVAGDAAELLKRIKRQAPPDLLVVDPEAPFFGHMVEERLRAGRLGIPVVVFHLAQEEVDRPQDCRNVRHVAKSGDTDELKRAIREMLVSWYPERTPAAPRSESGNS